MPCQRIETPLGVAIVCTRGSAPKKCACGKAAAVLCDAPKDRGTCDQPCCWGCTTQTRRNGVLTDYCPEHKALAKGLAG
jgi:hypothetical protein